MSTVFGMERRRQKAAGAVVREVPAAHGETRASCGEDVPEYGTCVDIVTKAALRENGRAGAVARLVCAGRR